ncbi:MAG TPA: hypothetical protein VK651_08045 [Blastocatellia bacterium]|nr:hypothetical protein [Blastocatellia bacterium]
MKICPVCNDSFADQLNFCDVDGTRLTREGSVQERNKWWSLLGAGLLVGALVISAASIIFLPKARVSTPVVNSEPQPSPAPPKPASAESAANVAATPSVSAEPEGAPTDAAVPEVKKKDKALASGNFTGTTPNPKAAALAAEDADKKSPSPDVNSTPPAPRKTEAPPSVKSVSDTRSTDGATLPQTPPDLKKDQKTQTATTKSSDRASNDKKKNDDKDKKKGGFLRVFKKIFGKD